MAFLGAKKSSILIPLLLKVRAGVFQALEVKLVQCLDAGHRLRIALGGSPLLASCLGLRRRVNARPTDARSPKIVAIHRDRVCLPGKRPKYFSTSFQHVACRFAPAAHMLAYD